MTDDSVIEVGGSGVDSDGDGGASDYILGVVEGFYGKPWSPVERVRLFERMKEQKMNCYIYAPKDDEKHRNQWRIAYTDQELAELKELIDACVKYAIEFVFSVSPGLSMSFASTADFELLLAKFVQLKALGCRSFALLWDDINCELQGADATTFESPAAAQCHVTNELLESVGPCKYFLFCPTEYCAAFAQPNVATSRYLETIGAKLDEKIEIMWTGPRVVSATISYESIKEITLILRRKPLIWDNIHANDYDRRRVYIGPYCGRHSALVGFTRGVMTNPNCEADANFVACHTLSMWRHTNRCRTVPPLSAPVVPSPPDKFDEDAEDDRHEHEHGGHGDYCPRRALEIALSDWLPCFASNQLTMEDLRLLAHLYYLPYEYGAEAIRLFSHVNYCLDRATTTEPDHAEWRRRFDELRALRQRIDVLTDRLVLCINQSPASIFAPLLADLSNVFNVLIAYLSFVRQFARLLVDDDMDINNRLDPKQEKITSEDKDLIDAESQMQILHSVTSRILLNLPKKIMNSFYFGEVQTPYFPRFQIDFSVPSRTRHGIFDEADENCMEFDDQRGLWPDRDLIRLDSTNVTDANIIFAAHATVHPLEHASILAVRDAHYENTVHLHLAVRQLNSLASVHSTCLGLICVLNVSELLRLVRIRIRIDNKQATSYTNMLTRFHFQQQERQPQVFTFTI